jgi:hypothetical protein
VVSKAMGYWRGSYWEEENKKRKKYMNTMNEEMRMRTREEGMESKHRESYQESSEGYVRRLYQG